MFLFASRGGASRLLPLLWELCYIRKVADRLSISLLKWMKLAVRASAVGKVTRVPEVSWK